MSQKAENFGGQLDGINVGCDHWPNVAQKRLQSSVNDRKGIDDGQINWSGSENWTKKVEKKNNKKSFASPYCNGFESDDSLWQRLLRNLHLMPTLRDVKAKIFWLVKRCGVHETDIGPYLTSNPYFLLQSFDDLKALLEYLQFRRFSRRQIAKLIMECRYWLNTPQEHIDARLGWLQRQFHLRADEQQRLAIVKEPRLIQFGVGPMVTPHLRPGHLRPGHLRPSQNRTFAARLLRPDICVPDICGSDICGPSQNRTFAARLLWPDICVPDICGSDICGPSQNRTFAARLLRPDICVPDICGPFLKGHFRTFAAQFFVDFAAQAKIGHLRPDICGFTQISSLFFTIIPQKSRRKCPIWLGPQMSEPQMSGPQMPGTQMSGHRSNSRGKNSHYVIRRP
ncbi:hypothetical protein niasHS_004132 [Heterodera schachtii]|uniref:Uncharacterized protein n=1 Tax=Heterodera schachtii TaxID=97005 RepID=A0ABD2K0L1_HETSC